MHSQRYLTHSLRSIQRFTLAFILTTCLDYDPLDSSGRILPPRCPLQHRSNHDVLCGPQLLAWLLCRRLWSHHLPPAGRVVPEGGHRDRHVPHQLHHGLSVRPAGTLCIRPDRPAEWPRWRSVRPCASQVRPVYALQQENQQIPAEEPLPVPGHHRPGGGLTLLPVGLWPVHRWRAEYSRAGDADVYKLYVDQGRSHRGAGGHSQELEYAIHQCLCQPGALHPVHGESATTCE